jgi:hypothetical protein
MFLYPADKNFIEPCPLSNQPSGPLCAGRSKQERRSGLSRGVEVLKNSMRGKTFTIQRTAVIRFFSRKSFSDFFLAAFPEHELEKAFSKISMQFLLGYDSFNLFSRDR